MMASGAGKVLGLKIRRAAVWKWGWDVLCADLDMIWLKKCALDGSAVNKCDLHGSG